MLPASTATVAVATGTTALATAVSTTLACGLRIGGCESCGGQILPAVLLSAADPEDLAKFVGPKLAGRILNELNNERKDIQ